MKTCKKCKREFEPDKKNRILCEYCRNIKKDVEPLSEFVYKLEKYNKKERHKVQLRSGTGFIIFWEDKIVRG